MLAETLARLAKLVSRKAVRAAQALLRCRSRFFALILSYPRRLLLIRALGTALRDKTTIAREVVLGFNR
jgi:hypothetical protein